MRTIGVVTVSRSDYGIYKPLLRRIVADAGLKLRLYVTGSHLWRNQGMTVREIEGDGMPIAARISVPFVSDEPEGIARHVAAGVAGFADQFASARPDILVVLGDRYDMYSAALAALPFKIPVAHLHGGELTFGAMDEALRHSLTKLSHLHFTSTEEYARRVGQLGEESWRITVSGALALDNLRKLPLLSVEEIRSRWGFDARAPFLLVTFHPSTLQYEMAERQTDELLHAVDRSGLPALFTVSNADTRGIRVAARIRKFVSGHAGARLVESLGKEGYFSVMARATAMVGNSSSGIIEAPSFKLPVVNVGIRQEGRVRAANVIDVPCTRSAILKGIRRAVSTSFRASLRRLKNPYERSGSAGRILRTLRQVKLGDRLLIKRFADGPGIRRKS